MKQIYYFLYSLLVLLLSHACNTVHCAYSFNFHIGQVNVTNFLKLNENNIHNYKTENVTCARVSYPSLYVFPGLLDKKELKSMDLHYGGSQFSRNIQYEQMVTVRHHGIPNKIKLSGILTAFVLVNETPDEGVDVCVYHSSYEDGTKLEDDDFPDLSIDWVSYIVRFTSDSRVNVYAAKFPQSDTLRKCHTISSTQSYPESIILSHTRTGTIGTSGQAIVWVDGIETQYGDTIFRVCVDPRSAATHSAKDGLYTISAVFIENKLEDPPSGVDIGYHEYQVENGNHPLTSLHIDPRWRLICVDRPFEKPFISTPLMFVSSSYRYKDIKNENEAEEATSAWVEYVNEVGYRACIGRPHRLNERTSHLIVPSLEYLTVSHDGIMDGELDKQKSTCSMMLLTIKFPEDQDMSKFLDGLSFTYLALKNGLSSIINDDEITANSFYVSGRAVRNETNTVTLFMVIKINPSDEKFESVENRFKSYLNETGNTFSGKLFKRRGVKKFYKLLYPEGHEILDKEHATVEIDLYRGCETSSFVSSACSVRACDGDTSGVKTLKRHKAHQYESKVCPPLEITLPCNLPPCDIKYSIYEHNTAVEPHSGSSMIVIILFILLGIAILLAASSWIYSTRKERLNRFRPTRHIMM